MKRRPSSASLAAKALEEAEEMLATLPHTTPVQTLHARLIAIRTVLMGVVRARPKLTETQEIKLTSDAILLAREVAELRYRLRGDEE